MKLTTIALAPLFWALSFASITLEPIPSELKAGSEYYVKWNQTRAYRLWNFDLTVLTREKNGDEWYKNVRVIDHILDFEVGSHEFIGKIYKLNVHGMPMGPPQKDEWLPGTPAYEFSNEFRIVGGPKLYKKEIAAVTLGTLAVMTLVIGGAVVGVRVWRKRREGVVAIR
ncbi:hypothetical protein MBLNU13_g04445t1 [Cladosporium sp. NU13]